MNGLNPYLETLHQAIISLSLYTSGDGELTTY